LSILTNLAMHYDLMTVIIGTLNSILALRE
jgi:hypothetical protein